MGHHAPMQLPGPGWQGPFQPSATGAGPAPPTEHKTSAARPPSGSPLATSQAAAQPLVPGRRGLLGWPAPAPWGAELAAVRFALCMLSTWPGCSMPHARRSALPPCTDGAQAGGAPPRP